MFVLLTAALAESLALRPDGTVDVVLQKGWWHHDVDGTVLASGPPATAPALSPAPGRYEVDQDGTTVVVTEHGEPVCRFDAKVVNFDILSDDRWIVVYGPGVAPLVVETATCTPRAALDVPLAAPFVAGDRLWSADGEGSLRAWSLPDGRPVVTFERRVRTRFAPGPVVVDGDSRFPLAGGRAIARAPDGTLVLTDANGAALRTWPDTGVERVDDAVEIGDALYVFEDERRVLRLDAGGVEVRETPGARHMRVSLAGAVEAGAPSFKEVFAPVAPGPGVPRLKLWQRDADRVAVDQEGRQWGAPIPGKPRDALLSPDGRVVVTRDGAELKGLALADGRVLWSARVAGASGLTLDDQALFVDHGDWAEARELATGRVVWTLRYRTHAAGGTPYGAILEGTGGSCVIEGPSRAGCPAWDGRPHDAPAPSPGAVVARPEERVPPWPEPSVPVAPAAATPVPSPTPPRLRRGRRVPGCERWNIGVVAARGTKVPPDTDRPTLVLAGAPGDLDLDVTPGVVILGLSSPWTSEKGEGVVFAEDALAPLQWAAAGRSDPHVVLVLPGRPDDATGLPKLSPGEGVLVGGECRERFRGAVADAVAAAHAWGTDDVRPRGSVRTEWTWRAPGDLTHLAALPDGALAWATVDAAGVVGPDGRPRWMRALAEPRPYVAGDALVVFAGGLLRAVDPRDGRDLRSPVSVEEVYGAAGGAIIAKRHAGLLTGLSPISLTAAWTYRYVHPTLRVAGETIAVRWGHLVCTRAPSDWRSLGCVPFVEPRGPETYQLDATYALVRQGDAEGGPFAIVDAGGRPLAWAPGWSVPAVGPGVAFSEVRAGTVVAWRW